MEPSLDQLTFSKNRGRLLKHAVAQQFFDAVVRQADALGLLSDEHFTVDDTLIEPAASLKSFKPKDKPPSDEPSRVLGAPMPARSRYHSLSGPTGPQSRSSTSRRYGLAGGPGMTCMPYADTNRPPARRRA